jgi:hypothetical protein
MNRLPSESQAAFSLDGPADDAAGQRKPQGAVQSSGVGIDYLDITFRIEKRLNFKIGRHDIPWPQTPGVHDITAGQLSDWAGRLCQNKTRERPAGLTKRFGAKDATPISTALPFPAFAATAKKPSM